MTTLAMTTAQILESQSVSGAFPSTVTHHGVTMSDENCFVTALIVYELLRLDDAAVSGAIDRALVFLESCRGPCGFHFYPPGKEPEWMGVRLPPDADDTALLARILYETGRLTLSEVTQLADTALEPHRQHYNPDPIAGWVHAGCYRTWLSHKQRPNPVDCCVNANVAALLAVIGRQESAGYRAACATVTNGIEWAGGIDWRLTLLTPYYPHPAEFFYSIERGIDAGIKEFREITSPAGWSGTLPCAGSLDRKTWWTSPELQALRNNRSTRRSQ
jgi:hypothetical protein